MAGELDGSNWHRRAALGHHAAGVVLTLPTLGGDAKFELYIVKAHASPYMVGKVAVGDAVADADDHVGECVWCAKIINANRSHLQ